MFLESVGGRKFFFACFGAVLLFGAYAIGKLDGVAFTGGIVALAGVFVEGNIRDKKITSGGKKK